LDASRPYFAPNAADNLKLPQAAQTNPIEHTGAAHIYFIANPMKSMREEQKETRVMTNANTKTRNCPESGRLTDSIE
jgi:hypothetical protein